MWGARLVAADAKWKLQPTWHATGTLLCETCDADQIRSAYFWFGPANPADRDVERQMSPEYFADLLSALHMPLAELPAEVRADGGSQPVTIAGLRGRARKIGIRSPDGRAYETIVVAVARGCVGLVAIASAANSRDLSLDRIGALASAIDIQRYGPMPDPCPPQPPDPRAPEDIPLLEQLQPKLWCAAADDGSSFIPSKAFCSEVT